jgi:hypothetical protein
MQERRANFNAGAGDPETTLVSPRFDADDARRAHPVVPLASAPPRAAHAGPRRSARRGLGRSWTPALLAVALLAGVAVGGVVASKVLRRAQPTPDTAAEAPATDAPTQAADVPAETQAPPAVEPPREVAATKPEPRTQRAARGRRAESAPLMEEVVRAVAEDFEDDDKGRRRDKGRGKHRDRAEDDAEKEMRKALKRAKDKAPRLVDVLVSP